MATGLMKLPENRVRRNYTGGAGIDRLHGKARQEDNNMPEEWVGSMVEASNPGMEPIAHEGLAVVETADGPRIPAYARKRWLEGNCGETGQGPDGRLL